MLRFYIAFFVFAPTLASVARTNLPLIKGGLEIGFWYALGYWGQSEALETSSASIVGFISSLSVIVVPFLDAITDKKKRSANAMINSLVPAVLAALGVACLELGGSNMPGVGELWASFQPIFFGFAYWRVERLMKLAKRPEEVQAFTGAIYLVVAVFSCFWSAQDFVWPLMARSPSFISGVASVLHAYAGQLWLIRTNWELPAALVWTGVVTTALISYIENIAVSISASRR